jgi:hypothetical protein
MDAFDTHPSGVPRSSSHSVDVPGPPAASAETAGPYVATPRWTTRFRIRRCMCAIVPGDDPCRVGAMIVGSAHIATGLFIGVVIAALLYFIPTVIAGIRHHHRTTTIFLLNLFLGWTLIGWIGALFWACSDPGPKRGAPVPPPPAD